MLADCEYCCYEGFDEIELKAANKGFWPVILDQLTSTRDSSAGQAEWTAPGIAMVIKATVNQYSIKMGKLGQPPKIAMAGELLSPPIDVTLQFVGQE